MANLQDTLYLDRMFNYEVGAREEDSDRLIDNTQLAPFHCPPDTRPLPSPTSGKQSYWYLQVAIKSGAEGWKTGASFTAQLCLLVLKG